MKSASALFDSEVTETAVDVPFYAVDGSLTKSIIVKESGNEIVFLYEKNKHNVISKPETTVKSQVIQISQ